MLTRSMTSLRSAAAVEAAGVFPTGRGRQAARATGSPSPHCEDRVTAVPARLADRHHRGPQEFIRRSEDFEFPRASWRYPVTRTELEQAESLVGERAPVESKLEVVPQESRSHDTVSLKHHRQFRTDESEDASPVRRPPLDRFGKHRLGNLGQRRIAAARSSFAIEFSHSIDTEQQDRRRGSPPRRRTAVALWNALRSGRSGQLIGVLRELRSRRADSILSSKTIGLLENRVDVRV